MVGEVCGAASGAVLAIGLLYGEQQEDAATYLTEQFMQSFAEQNGAVRCSEIIGFNLSSIKTTANLSSLKGLLKFGMQGGKKMCDGIVSSTVEILLDQLEEWEN